MPRVYVADCRRNAQQIIAQAKELDSKGVWVIAFPELSVTGYTCADLFSSRPLLEQAEKASCEIVRSSRELNAVLVFGAPVVFRGRLFNCAIVARRGKILGIVPKTYLAGNAEFYEPRWFESARVLQDCIEKIRYAGQEADFGTSLLFSMGEFRFGVEICQDLWSPIPPSTFAALQGAHLIVNLSASNEILLKHEYRKSLVSATSSRLLCAYLYCSSGYGESTQDLVWAGSSLISEYGSILSESERFSLKAQSICADIDIQKLDNLRIKEHSFRAEGSERSFRIIDAEGTVDTDFERELLRRIEPRPFVPQGDPKALEARCSEILSSQVIALATRLEQIHCSKAVIGISGGLDSTLALLVTALAFDRLRIPRSNIIGVTMPGFGTTVRTHDNSTSLMALMGIDSREISIVEATRKHFQDIAHDESIHDLTYENSQARERTQILMDISCKEGGIVIGTGDLSELALGWCTYNADHMSMYGVNVSIPKTLVRTLVIWAAKNRFADEQSVKAVLLDIADTPISPELLPADENGQIAQKTEDLVGPYELHDFFLYNYFRFGFSPDKILFLARKAFRNEWDEESIRKWLQVFFRRFFTQQFKRSCLPDGPKVGSVSLSPRGDWRMPSDISCPWSLSEES